MTRAVICALMTMLLVAAWAAPSLAEVTVQPSDKGAVVKIDGKLFTEYVTAAASEKNPATPILWPIIGPTGQPVTRAYPMAEGHRAERKDHPHHRSLWFNHGSVNGLSFWDRALIRHDRFVEMKSGPTGRIVTENSWVDGEGVAVCTDVRTLTFGVKGETRWVDFDIVVKAGEKPVTFGDTKEGMFGVRVAGTVSVDAAKPDRYVPDPDPSWGGHIANSEGLRDGQAWGKRAAWVDYYGPIEGETVGIAILNHPKSFRYPTYWHVRTYGLFTANPFGVRDFEGKEAPDGSYTLQPGESMTFHYRLLFHKGDEKQGRIAEAFAEYSAEEK